MLGSIVGFLPLFGWHAEPNQACLFVEVMDYNYLVFLYVATIITPAILLLAFYVHIYTVIIKQVKIKNKTKTIPFIATTLTLSFKLEKLRYGRCVNDALL